MSEFSAAALRVRAATQQRVGGFFRNCYVTHGLTCSVCYAPTADGMCRQCAGHHEEFGAELADQITMLTYVQGYMPTTAHSSGKHQSAYEVRAYKANPPVTSCMNNLRLLVKLATEIHGVCLQEQVGVDWQAVTFVPSKSRPGSEHPVARLAAVVHQLDPTHGAGPVAKFLVAPGPGIDCDSRRVRADRFVISEEWKPCMEGRHVLVVDDTWTSGCKMQSAAVALKRAGAAKVTGLCVSRWLNWNFVEQKPFIEALTEAYDPLRCPVRGDHCLRAESYGRAQT